MLQPLHRSAACPNSGIECVWKGVTSACQLLLALFSSALRLRCALARQAACWWYSAWWHSPSACQCSPGGLRERLNCPALLALWYYPEPHVQLHNRHHAPRLHSQQPSTSCQVTRSEGVGQDLASLRHRRRPGRPASFCRAAWYLRGRTYACACKACTLGVRSQECGPLPSASFGVQHNQDRQHASLVLIHVHTSLASDVATAGSMSGGRGALCLGLLLQDGAGVCRGWSSARLCPC